MFHVERQSWNNTIYNMLKCIRLKGKLGQEDMYGE